MSEPGDGVAGRDDACGGGGWLDDAVLGRFERVVEPAGEEIRNCQGSRVNSPFSRRALFQGKDSRGQKETATSRTVYNGTPRHRRRVHPLAVPPLNLQPSRLIVKQQRYGPEIRMWRRSHPIFEALDRRLGIIQQRAEMVLSGYIGQERRFIDADLLCEDAEELQVHEVAVLEEGGDVGAEFGPVFGPDVGTGGIVVVAEAKGFFLVAALWVSGRPLGREPAVEMRLFAAFELDFFFF